MTEQMTFDETTALDKLQFHSINLTSPTSASCAKACQRPRNRSVIIIITNLLLQLLLLLQQQLLLLLLNAHFVSVCYVLRLFNRGMYFVLEYNISEVVANSRSSRSEDQGQGATFSKPRPSLIQHYQNVTTVCKEYLKIETGK